MKIGDIFHESASFADPVTSRQVVRLTSAGWYNNTAGYHFNTSFTADSRCMVIKSQRGDGTALLRADLESGKLTVIACSAPGEQPDLYAVGYSVVPGNSLVAVSTSGSLRLYDIFSGEETILVRFEPGMVTSQPMGSIDGKYIYYSITPDHPEKAQGVAGKNNDFFEAFMRKYGGRPTTICRVEIASGKVEELNYNPTASSGHIQPNPVDPDLWLIELDQPPMFSWCGDFGKTSRAWTFNVRTSAWMELRPRNENRFHMHTNWSPDGRYVYYHARDRQTGYPIGYEGGGHYIGACDTQGSVVWERVFPHFYYGHVSSHSRKNAILIDSLITPDLIVQVNFEQAPSPDSVPPLEILGRHSSQVLYGKQHTHPHMSMSPDGRWLSFNRFDGVRSDVYLLEMI